MKRYVIIGNSAAAIGCVEGIRSIDKEGSITIISDEPHHTYSRPLISYLLYGKTDETRMRYRGEEFYTDNNVTAVLGKIAMKIDSANKKVVLNDGAEIPYDELLTATGSRPFVPPFKGLDSVKKKFTFMTLDDARAIEKSIDKNSRVLIVGAGLIGLKCAEGINHLVKSITVVDLADRILPSILDGEGAKIVQNHIEKSGVRFNLGCSVSEFSENKARFENGTELEFDVLILAVGVRPNAELIKEIGGRVNRGIIVDEKSRTSIESIFAAGDCTESYDITSDEMRVMALLPNAYRQGEAAGITMAGGEKKFDTAIPMNAIGFFGLHVITAGSYDGDKHLVSTGQEYKLLFTKNGLLKGYIMIGEVGRAGIYTELIRAKTPLDEIDFDMIKKSPQLMAFSKSAREKMLSEAH